MNKFLLLIPLLFAGSYSLCSKNNNVFPVINENEVTIICQRIDLKGKTISIPSGTTLVFSTGGEIVNGFLIVKDKVTIKGGVFRDVSLFLYGSLHIFNSSFICPNRNTAIYRSPRWDASQKKVVIEKCFFYNIGENLVSQSSSTSAIHLQNVSDVKICKCVFKSIGNKTTLNASAIIIGTSATENELALSLPNANVRIEKSLFNGVATERISGRKSGEEHFIMIEGTSGVLIKNNSFYNVNTSLEYDNEYIYTKCDNIDIVSNTIRGSCGGEGFICCKPFRFAGVSHLTHANIIANDIEGNAFSLCTHYGEGVVKNNRLINAYTGFIVCLKKTAFEGDDNCSVITISRNRIVSNATISEIPFYTSTQRSAIFLDCAREQNRNSKILFSNNSIIINESVFPAFINLRDFTETSFTCCKNKVQYCGNNPIRFIYLQSVDKDLLKRENATLVLKKNRIKGFEADVYLPSNAIISDSLVVEASDAIIIDKR